MFQFETDHYSFLYDQKMTKQFFIVLEYSITQKEKQEFINIINLMKMRYFN